MSRKEFEYYADIVRRENRRGGQPEPSSVMPGTVGQMDKQTSDLTFDKIAAFDKM